MILLEKLEELVKLSGQIFGFLGVVFEEKLAFKNIKISVWQKR